MNLSEARAKLRTICGNLTVGQLPNATADDYINEATRQLSLQYKFREVRCITSFSTEAGEARYQLPSDLSYLRVVWDGTNKKKIQGPYNVRVLAELPTRTNGKPIRYIREKTFIHLDPPPSGAFTIYLFYVKNFPALTNDDDILQLPVDWHLGICWYARWLYYTDRQDYGKAQNAINLFKLWASEHPVPVDREIAEADLPAEFVELGRIVHDTGRGRDFDTFDESD